MERRIFVTGGVALAALGLAGCGGRGKKDAPPAAAAPAHGHRFRHAESGLDLVFDSRLGVYVAPDFRHYYLNGRFFRRHPSGWQVSPRYRGPWRWARSREVPAKLAGAR